jgi:M6 family metalloprotease-like protein
MHTLRSLLAATLGTVVAAVASGPLPVAAQDDVVQLGRHYGTTPPDSYFRTIARNPRAFTFSRGWMARNPRLRVVEEEGQPPRVELRARGSGTAGETGPAAALGRRDGPVEGTFRFPLLLGYYQDMSGPPPFGRAQVQAEFFDGPSSRFGTIPEFYDELSRGRVDLVGTTFEWAQSTLTGDQVSGGVSGLGYPGRVGEFILDLLATADAGGLDWGQYDNDGPDGLPNSGDDDGWVDLLAVFQPTNGAECGGSGNGNRVWSHKWNLSDANSYSSLPVSQRYFTTSSVAVGGGFIRVDDYTIQPVWDCPGNAINEIGVFAHELGHGFGLPDLYCTAPSCPQEGIGRWGLMGSGAWGCSVSEGPARPCHMSAWSKAVLGWADVTVAPPDEDLGTIVLEPVETTGAVVRVDVQDGSGEYYLLENRQRLGFDQGLVAPGVLVWHVDGPWIDTRWPANAVNNVGTHLGVWLRQADGRGQLESSGSDGNRGDAGDPFPGSTGARAFHAGSNPSSFTHDGRAAGLTLLDIAVDASGAATFRALTRFQSVRVRTEGEGSGGLLTVDGVGQPGSTTQFESAPFQAHDIVAAAGEPLGEGRRRAFEAWADDDEAGRERTVVTGLVDAEYAALYGAIQVHLDVELEGGAFDVAPGTIVTTPSANDLWFQEGTQLLVTAAPTPGFDFVRWGGALAGEPNPTTFVMDTPLQAQAVFELAFALPEEVAIPLEAAAPPSVQLVAPEGTAPFTWTVLSGSLPEGLELSTGGSLAGTPLEEGVFTVDLGVEDALGLEATGRVRFEVGPPDVPLATLAAPLLGVGTHPTPAQVTFLDRNGNDDGSYDVGDLRIFLRAHPDLPAAVAAARGEIVIPVVRVPGARVPGGGS